LTSEQKRKMRGGQVPIGDMVIDQVEEHCDRVDGLIRAQVLFRKSALSVEGAGYPMQDGPGRRVEPREKIDLRRKGQLQMVDQGQKCSRLNGVGQ